MPIQNLPDLFQLNNGSILTQPADWSKRRQELLDAVLAVEYGPIPPPAPVRAELLNKIVLREAGFTRSQHRLIVETNPAFSFVLDWLVPLSETPRPVILNGDACWGSPSQEITRTILEKGYALATFNRTEIAPDHGEYGRTVGLYTAFPNLEFGALSAWAWGYHRVVDFLLTLPEVDRAKVAITGHSRGGKAVLLAGATDERIALTNPNDSGCGGAGCFRIEGKGSETLEAIVTRFPYWFNPALAAYIGREQELPFDQHFLKAAVAPRLLLTTEALGDLWANPSGTWHTHAAAREIYRFLGVDENIGIWYREGGHAHGYTDYKTLLDFAEWKFYNRPPQEKFDFNPFLN